MRVARDRFGVCLGGGVVGVGELVVVEGDGSGHDALAVAGDAVSAGAGNLGDEAVAAEFDDEPGDAFASSSGVVAIQGPSWVEPAGDVSVAEAWMACSPARAARNRARSAVLRGVKRA